MILIYIDQKKIKLKEIDQIVEALLFASPEPLTQKKINSIFDKDPPNLEFHIKKLINKYSKQNHGIEVLNIAGGFQIRTKPDFDIYVRKLLNNSGQLYLSNPCTVLGEDTSDGSI